MFYWDWTMILVIPGLILGLWAQMRVSSAFKKYSAVHARSGMSAEEAARSILNEGGCGNVSVRTVSGNLTDHYDPRSNTLRLSDGVYGSTSVAAICRNSLALSMSSSSTPAMYARYCSVISETKIS